MFTGTGKVRGMSTGQEIEVKRMLVGNRPIEALTALLGEGTVAKQRNFVLDTSHLDLRAARYSLRVRDQDGSYSLTAKGPSTRATASTSVRTEAEAELEPALAAQVLEGALDPLAVLHETLRAPALLHLIAEIERAKRGRSIEVLGDFRNVRRSIPVVLPSGLKVVLELDTTTLPNGNVEYEAEIELGDASQAADVEAWLEQLVRKAGIHTAPATAKVARFFQALGKLQSEAK
jgi:uncharacterized protein YjbK